MLTPRNPSRRALRRNLAAARYHGAVTDVIEVRRLVALGEPEIAALAAVLHDCVQGGASVSFMLPLSVEKASGYWRGVAAQVARGESIVLAAWQQDSLIGTVTLILTQPENQPHRADLAKMLVHRRARRRGVGGLLLAAAEAEALRVGKTLLVLDTASHDAERVYARGGWRRVGEIPDYALWPAGGYCATTLFYKRLK
jgi:GNAT superfamily N-acetyltransferase